MFPAGRLVHVSLGGLLSALAWAQGVVFRVYAG